MQPSTPDTPKLSITLPRALRPFAVTVTEREEMMRCPAKWDYTSFNRRALTPIFTAPALSLGRLWHQTQAEWMLNPSLDPVALATGFFSDEQDAIREQYKVKIGAYPSPSELEPLEKVHVMLRAMVGNYQKRWVTPLPDGFLVLNPEQTGVVPIPGTTHNCPACGSDGWVNSDDWFQALRLGADASASEVHQAFDLWQQLGGEPEGTITCPRCKGVGHEPIYLEFTLDALLLQQSSDRLFILERKTYGQRPNSQSLNTNDQFIGYLWGLQQLQLGIPIGGIAYDGVWKRDVPPKGSVLEDLFLRLFLTRTQYELDKWGEECAQLAMFMYNFPTDSRVIWRNRQWMGCWDCGMEPLCLAEMKGEDIQYLLDTHYMVRPREEYSLRDTDL